MKGLVSIILITASWQAASMLGWLNPYLMPPPSKVLRAFITFIASFFPMFLHTFSGVRHIEEIHLNAARTLGADRKMLLLDVAIPSALPFIVTGLRISLGFAWMSVIAAELIASSSGLGYMIEMNRSMMNIPNVICGMVTIGAVGYVMNEAIVRVERRFSWKPGRQEP